MTRWIVRVLLSLAGMGGTLTAGLWLGISAANAAEYTVAPGALADSLRQASAGDVLRLMDGRYAGNFVIDKPLTLIGAPDSRLDGEGRSRVLTVDAPGVVVQGVTVVNSGSDLSREDAGIFVTEKGEGSVIRDNRLGNNLIGIYLKGARKAVVRNNVIHGQRDARLNERGNGIHIWNAPGAVVDRNVVRYGRDGIFVTTSRDNEFTNNDFRDVRFAIHYMYTEDSRVRGNRSYGNHVGYALMYSRKLDVRRNLSVGDRDHGLLLNYVLNSTIDGNKVKDSAGKCTFIYNANINVFTGNWFEGCAIGIHFTAGSERNVITGNAFVGNRHQVKYVGTRRLNWSRDGRGNYWSDYANYDLGGDGIGDRPYRPNDLVDHIIWAHPDAKLLLKSPAIEILRYAQRQLPALHPGGVIDPAPLMQPPKLALETDLMDGAREVIHD